MHAHVQEMEQDEDYEFDYEDSDQVRLGCADLIFSRLMQFTNNSVVFTTNSVVRRESGGKKEEIGEAQTRGVCFSPVASHAAAHLCRLSDAVMRLRFLSIFLHFVLEGPRWADCHRELYHGQVDIGTKA